MKLSKIIVSAVVLISAVSVALAQQQFTQTVTAQNKNCNATCSVMDVAELNNNPSAIILITPLDSAGKAHPITAYYMYLKKWSVMNLDGVAIAEGAKFKVEYFVNSGPDRFVYVVPRQVHLTDIPYIDHEGLNNNPNAQIRVSRNGIATAGGLANRDEIKVEYDATVGKWYVANLNKTPVPWGAAYNVVFAPGGASEAIATNRPVESPTRPPRPDSSPKPSAPPTPTPVPVSIPFSSPTPSPAALTPVTTIAPNTAVGSTLSNWVLRPEQKTPIIPANSDILLFIHGMDSRAEEADDLTRALFAALANQGGLPASPSSTATSGPAPPDPQMVQILQGLLQKYKDCILERYETKQDMINRGLDGSLSGLFTTNGLQARDTIKCVAGNNCSLAFRTSQYQLMQAQANRGEATNFQQNLENIIPKDCFECQKHKERHTKHVHCTMEAGGNSGIPAGPTFESCKAGVDYEALVRVISDDLASTVNDVKNLHKTPPDKTGGPSIATNYSTVRFDSCPDPAKGCPEQCDSPDNVSGGQRNAVVPGESGGPRLYFEPVIPLRMLDTPPPAGSQINVPAAHNIGRNEGRLRPELRSAAKAANPRESLRLAAYQFAGGDTEMGNAFADLSVTGSSSFGKFSVDPPQESFCQAIAAQHPSQLTESSVLAGCHTALDRAYLVANFLRTGQRADTPDAKTAKMNERNALGWIAVSGEDDQPHRPVNVPSSDYPQYDMDVVVEAPMAGGSKSVTVHARYVVAQSQPGSGTGRNLVVISFDLPTSGYSTNLDYESISPLAIIGNPKWTVLPVPLVIPGKLPYQLPVPSISGPVDTIALGTPIPDFEATGMTPLLDFIETFVVRFTETLDAKVPIRNNIRAVMGGSLGGNMTFRLGRRQGVPWLPKFIVWSPASIWTSLGEGADVFKHYPVRVGWEGADKARTKPSEGDRAAFFASWDKEILPLLIPMAQSDTWMSDFYPCKKSAVAAARLQRHETYDARFYAWHWRLGTEQLLFSQLNKNPATNKPLYLSNQKPMLLACGVEDHVAWNDICPATQTTAQLMTFTPGKALFLDKTGHSLDNERRSFWAQQILDFIK